MAVVTRGVGARRRVVFVMLGALTATVAVAAPTFQTLFSFKSDGLGEHPWAAPTLAPDGSLFGVTYQGGASGVGTAYRLKKTDSGSWKRTVLHQFGGAGAGPIGGLVLAPSGALYGTTESGGGGECSGGCGVVYELAPRQDGSYAYSAIHRFKNVASGVRSQSRLAIDAEGALYGTTNVGGSSDMGTVFKLVKQDDGWKISGLHDFSGGAGDGKYPFSGVVFGPDSALYGATQAGGRQFGDRGTVYRLAKASAGSWSFSLLYAFGGGEDGEKPLGPVAFDRDGALYGMTSTGGASATCFGGCGTAFRLKGSGAGPWTKKTIHSFSGTDGSAPRAGLTVDAAGSLWGTTPTGGGGASAGVIFRLDPPADGKKGWDYKLVRSFANTTSEGGIPFDGLTLDRDSGAFYGTTRDGGEASNGTVFRLKP